jgi:hypothetical protein
VIERPSVLTAMFICMAGFVVSVIATEVLRGIVDARRVRRTGIGGTQDVALCGMAAYTACLLAAVACLVFWLASR